MNHFITRYKLIPILLIYFFSKTSVANCSKEDINYYLEKGFTTDQVTALCSGGDGLTSIKEDAYKSYSEEYADEEDEEYLRKMSIERQVFFKSSLGVQRVNIRKDILSFINYECAKDGLAKPGSMTSIKRLCRSSYKNQAFRGSGCRKEFKEKVFFGNRQILKVEMLSRK